MADKKISQLTALSAANLAPSTDVLAIVDTSATETKKIAAQDIVNGVLNVASAVGIGTASPAQKLHVENNANSSTWAYVKNTNAGSGAAAGLLFANNTGDLGAISLLSSTNTPANGLFLRSLSTNVLALGTNNTVQATLDSSGNLGLGVTPSASWFASAKAMQIGSSGAPYMGLAQQTTTTCDGYMLWGARLSGDRAFQYTTTGDAVCAYRQNAGTHNWFTAGSGTAGNAISFTQAMTLHASGGLSVGSTTDPGAGAATISGTSTNSQLAVTATGVANTTIGFNASGSTTQGIANNTAYVSVRQSYPLAFGTAETERGRFSAGGFFKASNTGTYANSTNDRHELRSDKNDINVLVSTTSTGASVVNVYSQFPASPNAGAYHFAGVISGSGYQFTVDADGDVKNTNGSYAAISDLKLKQDIEDAASQWNDIKSVRVRKYRFKRTPDAPLQIGVIAQELEQTSPGLVSEDADRDDENNDLGTTTKSVKYSILYMKAVKALQEAMARIESLEADVAALKGAK